MVVMLEKSAEAPILGISVESSGWEVFVSVHPY